MKKTYYMKNVLRNAMTYENNKNEEIMKKNKYLRVLLGYHRVEDKGVCPYLVKKIVCPLIQNCLVLEYTSTSQ